MARAQLLSRHQAGRSVIEQKWEARKGTFGTTAAGITIHWTDDTGPGDREWVVQIRQRHILVTAGGEAREYHYVPPGLDMDL